MALQFKTSTITFHRAQPDVTLEQHVRMKRLQLGEYVKSKYKIYLDLRFWIFLRDVELGRNNNHDLVQLLSKIKHLVDNGIAICPISEAVFIEIMKQSDPETRFATTKLIDHLSAGITLIVAPDRTSQELCHAIYSLVGANDLIPLDNLVWTKLSCIFGETHPSQTSFDASEELVIQKAFFDYMWEISLTEIFKNISFEDWPQQNYQKTANNLNVANKQHAHELRSYEQTYRIEFEGGLSLLEEELQQIIKEVENTGYKGFEEHPKKISKNKLFHQFSKSIRTLHIGACCYAAVRWDQKRQLTGNDLLDFNHAQAAIGYCNLFLTEKPLMILVNQRHLNLMRDFPCIVVSTASDGLQELNREIG